MHERPIIRFPEPTKSARRTGSPSNPPRAQGPGRQNQGTRFQPTFDALAAAFNTDDPEFTLRQNPSGIAPERALVFVTAGNVRDFTHAAREIGLEVFAEDELEDIEEYPDGFEAPGTGELLPCTLYATVPTIGTFEKLLSLWSAYQNGVGAPRGAAPWWNVFGLLLELRPWGPTDRLTGDARAVIEDRLPFDDNEEVAIEFEIWPTAKAELRTNWRETTERRIVEAGGKVVDRCSISSDDFTYEAILALFPAYAVRNMLDGPSNFDGLLTYEGIQFVLPQTVGQSAPGDPDGELTDLEFEDSFDVDAPVRAALIDGTPVAGHAAINDGVVIEDMHDLVRLSEVKHRFHATAMASLILRGDLEADGNALQNTRLLSVPVLVDSDNGAWTPPDRLFIDLLHTTLTGLLTADEPLAADVFVVNFAIGLQDTRFAGRISSLARFMDWWAAKEGVLFVISAGNISDGLTLAGASVVAFEDADIAEKQQIVAEAMRASAHERTLLAPAEGMNGLTVGALSKDLNGDNPARHTGIITLENDDQSLPQITSALGLGFRRAIKPDLLYAGGRLEARVTPSADGAMLHAVGVSQRTGLNAASPVGGAHGTQKSRGTSPAAALTTRAILQSAESLTGEDGPYEGQELPRRELALLTRALAVNSARWPEDAHLLYRQEHGRLGKHQHARARMEVCRYFGHGVLVPELMQQSPDTGATLVGLGSVKKDQAQIFKMPLPASMSGDRVPRSLRVTITWFSPVNSARSQYRLAGLEAVAADEIDNVHDGGWQLDLKTDGPDANMVKRGSVWSRRLINRTKSVPGFEDGAEISICVQCRDTANGGLNPDDDMMFAIAVTLEVEAEVSFDIYDEVQLALRVRLGTEGG
ncbi:MAG: S8 family serine peptidase [Granulosicoccus sp.]